MVAAVVTASNVTCYLLSGRSDRRLPIRRHGPGHRAVWTGTPVATDFSIGGTNYVGADSYDLLYEQGAGGRNFDGSIKDVAFFGYSLTPAQLQQIFGAGSSLYAPYITNQPAGGSSVGVGGSVQLQAGVGGTLPLTYQWMAGTVGSGIYTNLTDANGSSGTATPTLQITGANANDTADYVLVVTNLYGSVQSTVATVTVIVPPTAMFTVYPAGGWVPTVPCHCAAAPGRSRHCRPALGLR